MTITKLKRARRRKMLLWTKHTPPSFFVEMSTSRKAIVRRDWTRFSMAFRNSRDHVTFDRETGRIERDWTRDYFVP